MADSSLDDFFAKKDKSKKKTKSKTVSEAPVQQNFSVRKLKKKKDQEKQPSTTMAGGPKNNEFSLQEDTEWNDYEQETEKDYSGLRIQNLQIKNEDDDDLENEFNLDNDENNETGERRENHSGPWNKSGQSTTPVPTVVKVVKEEEEEEEAEASPTPSEEAPKNVGRYIPPGQRGQHASSMTPTEARMARIRNSKKEAPNIHCEVDFPSLGGAVNDIETKDFERVRGGTRNYEDPSNTSLQLKLNNKYRALQD